MPGAAYLEVDACPCLHPSLLLISLCLSHSFCLFVFVSRSLSLSLSIYLSILSIHLPICLSIYLLPSSVSLSVVVLSCAGFAVALSLHPNKLSIAGLYGLPGTAPAWLLSNTWILAVAGSGLCTAAGNCLIASHAWWRFSVPREYS